MKELSLIRRLRYRDIFDNKDSEVMPAVNQSSDESSLPSPRVGGGGGKQKSSERVERVEMRRPGTCSTNICGDEAACVPHSDNTYTCVCPHDNSQPTEELKCPNRNTVHIKPHRILNIIPPAGVYGTNSSANTNAQQPAPNIDDTTTIIPQPAASIPQAYPAVHDLRVLAGLASGSLLLLVVFLIICCWKRRQLTRCGGKGEKSKGTTSCTPSPLVLKKSILVADRYTLNPQYTACSTTSPSPSVPLLRAETLRFMHEIGEGCFGKVFKGELQRDSDVGDETEIVAIKVLKDNASREAEEDFMREVDIMSAFRHPNILSLIGVVPRESGMSPMMVFEYMPHGDLAEVLRSNARYCGSRPPPPPGADFVLSAPILDAKALLSVALQIAAGMRYLAAQRFVHRDLACRNCLVAQGPVVKIADFGMSRDVYTCDYYKIGGSRLLPVRWMSPESVMYGRFTLESDIWSYGIVLWEIYSFGKQPYYGHTNEEVVKLILQGIMLIPPEDCPTLIYDLMRSCWKTEPRDRIRFPDIFEKLEKAYDNFQVTEAANNLSTVLEIEQSKQISGNVTLPRPPPIPIAQLDGILDTDGYLLPQETNRANYLQALPD